mmetsp:Transcript_13986/g.27899  ORF Transcript_13986/g.27899 Transcript_13986/m.27899 type:complete len:89 (-) Transcript_13986:1087-1353(-)
MASKFTSRRTLAVDDVLKIEFMVSIRTNYVDKMSEIQCRRDPVPSLPIRNWSQIQSIGSAVLVLIGHAVVFILVPGKTNQQIKGTFQS